MSTMLLIAASRGLGLAMAEQFLKKDWNVVGTLRSGSARTKLHDLADRYAGRLEIESVDITNPAQITALRQRLSGRTFEMLFVNAGTTNNNPEETIGEVTTDEFMRVMLTNALSPMRVIETLQDLVTENGLIGAMSSGQGSVANNISGMREVYRGSKAALNQYMRCFAARQAKTPRALVLMAPGWVRTDLGGPEARLTIRHVGHRYCGALMPVNLASRLIVDPGSRRCSLRLPAPAVCGDANICRSPVPRDRC